MDDRFSYCVSQTPRDSSCHNSFFCRSSPTSSTSFINSIQGVSTRLRNLGKGGDNDDEPLQLRVSSMEETLDSVHMTVANLETAMGDIDDKPLQLRVSSIKETLDSVHTTVANLETAMGGIVKLLQAKPNPDPTPPQFPSTPSKITTFPEPKATVTNHPTAKTTQNPISYAESM
jgi:hypothetical protein